MKAFLINLFLLISAVAFAQEDKIYVVFRSDTVTAIENTVMIHFEPDGDNDYDPDTDRCPEHYFKLQRRACSFRCFYIYENPLDKPDNPVIIKPASFLDEIEFLDLDIVAKSMTREELMELKDHINSHKTIYFIDRNEIENGMMKIYPVRRFVSAY